MKKKAFTIAEVMVALGIVAVIAAMLVPAIGKAMPDKNKFLYLKAYDSLNEAVQGLINNKLIYTPIYKMTCENKEHVYKVNKYPLLDFNQPVITELANANYQGRTKIAYLLNDALSGSDISCNDRFCSFKTNQNDMEWQVETPENSLENCPTSGQISYMSKIDLKFMDNSLNTSEYSSFRFFLDADGSVIPADRLGQAYIGTRTKKGSINNETLNKYSKIEASSITTEISVQDMIPRVQHNTTPGGPGEPVDQGDTPDAELEFEPTSGL